MSEQFKLVRADGNWGIGGFFASPSAPPNKSSVVTYETGFLLSVEYKDSHMNLSETIRFPFLEVRRLAEYHTPKGFLQSGVEFIAIKALHESVALYFKNQEDHQRFFQLVTEAEPVRGRVLRRGQEIPDDANFCRKCGCPSGGRC
ncbi:MAG: hypothetical protein U0841_07465 [Chloroflexia bacterium]